SQIKSFLDGVRYNEAIYIGSKRYFFSLSSFDEASSQILKILIDSARVPEIKGEKQQRIALLDPETFGSLLAISYEIAEQRFGANFVSLNDGESEFLSMPGLYCGTIEESLKLAPNPAILRFELNYLEVP